MQSNNENTYAHGSTHAKGKAFVYTWSVHNFTSLNLNRVSIDSPTFFTNFAEDMSWSMNVQTYNCGQYMGVVFKSCTEEIKYNKEVHLTIWITDYKDKEIVARRRTLIPHKFEDFDFQDFVKMDFLYDSKNGLFSNGTLTIKCKLFFLDEMVKDSYPKSLQKYISCNCNLKELFETKKLSDTVLNVGDKKFEVHKCILAAQSTVFSAMFEHDMKEKNDNTVNIDDIEPKVIEEMLRFIYCGKTEGFQDVSSLLIAADKYAISELKSICEDQLINNVSAENVGKTLILADKYKADGLKHYAMQFILAHPKEINFEQFKRDVESHSPLLIDMLRSLV